MISFYLDIQNLTFIGITDKNHLVNEIPSESHDIQNAQFDNS